MKLFVLAACLVIAVVVCKEDKCNEYPEVFDYHRRFGIPRANALLNAAKEQDAQVEDNLRIVGGSVIDISQVPYQAGLLITILGTSTPSVCGASLISSNRLVTAAHCQYDGWNTAQSFIVVLGSNTILAGGLRITTTDVVMHPNSDPDYAANDIAVIRIAISVVFTNVIQPIALPDGHVNNNFYGWNALASGFGRTSDGGTIPADQRISAVNLPVIGNVECATHYGLLVHGTSICTKGVVGKGTCFGDSGGPLAVNFNNANILIGVTSYGGGIKGLGCESGSPPVYTRVTSSISWIRSI